MISSTGHYWSTGIIVRWRRFTDSGKPGWAARLRFFDDGICSDHTDLRDISTEGTLHTRYHVADEDGSPGLDAAIDVMLTDADSLSIRFNDPFLYYEGDGTDPDYPPPPGWRQTLAAQAGRIGWQSYEPPAERS